jgi:tRNA A-37 threonylcarbamoyl transferase component Bud32
MPHTKRFTGSPVADVATEVALQRIGAEYGVSPEILGTDDETYITMEDVGQMNIADMYGEKIEDIPETLKRDIWNILWTLYSCANIEYIDVTPYNFIEKDGRVWVIDYGHAKKTTRGKIDPWLLNVLCDPTMTLSEWNAEFA